MSAGRKRTAAALTLAALGVVFGDIGTSPLYTLKTCFDLGGGKPGPADVLGVCSLLAWALVVVVCLKYVTFIMRVDHQGEGGILALLALLSKPTIGGTVGAGAITVVVTIGASMLFGDGVITPAISVISALEGIGVGSNAFAPYIVPLAVIVLLSLFAVQSRGTERVGQAFGPVMILWFVAIAATGIASIAAHPEILAALDPRHAAGYLAGHGLPGLLILGGVVLAVTGVEALYADLSHFGRPPIVRAWFIFVFPALLCNYFGQGAAVLADPKALANPFYALTPGWATIPMTVLATAATVIASQALISGAFTLVEQAIALGLSPRMEVRHTSRKVHGQVFVPSVDIALAIGCILLVLVFRSSDRLAAAYGLAVSFTMLATSIAYYAVVTRIKHWPVPLALALVTSFVIVDGSFVVTSLPKFLDGGYLPIAISAVLTTIALTWLEGRRCLAKALASQQTPLEDVRRNLDAVPVTDPSATMVFLSPDPNSVPFLAGHEWVRDRAREERIVLLHLSRAASPYLDDAMRVSVDRLSPRLIRVVARFGYMEPPRIEPILRSCEAQGLDIDSDDTSFFYADPKIEKAPGGMWAAQRWLFTVLQRNSRPLPDDLQIRAERRIELGLTVGL